MILSDRQIRRMIEKKDLVHPVSDDQINPASVNLTLGSTFLMPKVRHPEEDGIQLGDKVEYERLEIDEDRGFLLQPGEFALATTRECVNIPHNIAAFVQGRSSIGRIGLTTQNAGFVDPGFHGHITLELVNESPNTIFLTPGYPVAQLVFFESYPSQNPYSGKYNNQVEATGSRMHMDKEVHGFATGDTVETLRQVIDQVENDAISRSALLAEIDKQNNGQHVDSLAHIGMIINDMPAIDVAPVVHARWETREYTTEDDWDDWGVINHREEVCSECGKWQSERSKFCSHCGAKMDKEENDEH